jgi:hypothetical protein
MIRKRCEQKKQLNIRSVIIIMKSIRSKEKVLLRQIIKQYMLELYVCFILADHLTSSVKS